MTNNTRRGWRVNVRSEDCPYFGMLTGGGCGHPDGPRWCCKEDCPISLIDQRQSATVDLYGPPRYTRSTTGGGRSR